MSAAALLGCSSTINVLEIEYPNKITFVDHSAGNNFVIIGDDDGKISQVSTDGKVQELFAQAPSYPVTLLKQIGSNLISVGGTTIYIWNVDEKKLVRSSSLKQFMPERAHPEFRNDSAVAAAMSPNNTYLAVAEWQELYVLNYPSMTLVCEMDPNVGCVFDIVFLNEDFIVVSGTGCTLLAIDLRTRNIWEISTTNHALMPKIKKADYEAVIIAYDESNCIRWITGTGITPSTTNEGWQYHPCVIMEENSPLLIRDKIEMNYTYRNAIKRIAISPSVRHYLVYFSNVADLYDHHGKLLWRKTFERRINTIEFLSDQLVAIFFYPS
jgi:WD40 repeat protein